MYVDPILRDKLPPLSAEERAGLEESILREGCRDALVIASWPGGEALADGHNRYDICTKHGIPYKTTTLEFESKDDAVLWICDNQLNRRNLAPFYRAEVALIKEPIIARKAKERQLAGLNQYTDVQKCTTVVPTLGQRDKTEKVIAKDAGVGHDTIRKVKKIIEKADPETQKKLREGDPSLSINKVYNDIRREEKREEIRTRNEQLPEPTRMDGKYHTIVVDPPWDMKKIDRDVRPNQVEFDYPTMSLDEIKAFPISDIAEDECHMYLWTTQKHLPDAFAVLDVWGFKYIFTMVWHKPGGFQPVGLPQYNCEFVLFGRRGGQGFLDTKAFPTCFNAPRHEHSRKPDEFYDLVRRVSPGPRIDVFSREKRDEFDQYGNDTGRFQ